ncbi:MAG: DUF4157 domain-containing protein [Ekhidna sp.]|uniref:eCIS core domain-containing protein n=1 Tax=Ekhidna sp. TaxID=2608089 RepID=UPI003298EAA3
MAGNVTQKKSNSTGLPDNLKSGIENLSGYSMDDVKVHYNSQKPAQLQAHAFAQGNQIHLASGQDKHLPHEAWHVVQQKQGRVQPTMKLKSSVLVNDDRGLEKEADVMGVKALQLRASHENSSFLKQKSLINSITTYQLGKKKRAKRKKAKENLQNTIDHENKKELVKVFKKEWKGKQLPFNHTYQSILNHIIRGSGFSNIESAEKSLRMLMQHYGLNFELGFVYKKGRLKSLDIGGAAGGVPGANATVSINQDKMSNSLRKSEEKVVTHNHPSGSPLSEGDVAQAADRNYKEIRATGRYGTFSMVRKKKVWGPVTRIAIFNAFSTGGAALWDAATPVAYRDYVPIGVVGQNQTGATFKQDYFMDKYFAARRLARQFPNAVKYTAPDVNRLVQIRLTLYQAPVPVVHFGALGGGVRRGGRKMSL